MCHAAVLMGCVSVAVLSMLSNPLGNVLGKPPLGFLPLDPIGSDLSEKFSTPTLRNSRLDSRSLLDSRSSSPSDSDTSGFSSGSDHLSDLIVSLGLAPTVCLIPGVLSCFWGAWENWRGCRAQPCLLRRGKEYCRELSCPHRHSKLLQPRVWKEGCILQHKLAISLYNFGLNSVLAF